MEILVQFLNREKHVICFTPSAYTASSWLWRGQVFLQGRMNHVSAWSEGWQDHSCSNGVSQSHRRIRYLFLKTGMNEKQKTLSHHDQGKKEKVNDGKKRGTMERRVGLFRGHLVQQAGPWQKQLYRNYSNKNFSSPFLKISLGISAST